MLVIALLCFEVFFLAVVVWLARPVLDDVAWWAILLANVLAAGGMLAYFFVGHRALGRALLGPRSRVAREGFVAGALGAAAVAVWFLLYDTAAGAPLRTPALLGAAVLEGLRDPAALTMSLPLILKYTLVHVAAFLVFGWLAAGLLALGDRAPQPLSAFVMLFVCFEVFFVGMIAVLAQWLLEALAWDDPGGEPCWRRWPCSATCSASTASPGARSSRRHDWRTLSPTPRRRAEEILRWLAPVEREAPLVKCSVSHDTCWLVPWRPPGSAGWRSHPRRRTPIQRQGGRPGVPAVAAPLRRDRVPLPECTKA
jgi:hypothetical protein